MGPRFSCHDVHVKDAGTHRSTISPTVSSTGTPLTAFILAHTRCTAVSRSSCLFVRRLWLLRLGLAKTLPLDPSNRLSLLPTRLIQARQENEKTLFPCGWTGLSADLTGGAA